MISRVIRSIEEWLTRLALGIILVIMLLVTADVTLRYLFNSPIRGAFELTEVLMVAVVFLTIAYTMRQGRHVSIEFIVAHLSKRVQAVVDCFTLLLVLGISTFIAWQSTLQAIWVLQKGDTTVLLKIPTFPVRLLVPLGMFLLCLEVAVLLANKLREAISDNKTES